jgi:hypothetical protein
MSAIDEAAGEPIGKAQSPRSSSPPSEAMADADLLTITVRANTGQIVKIESVNDTGGRHELSDKEKTTLAKKKGKATLESILEQAFEAGIVCILGDSASEDDLPESEEDSDLRHFLLRPLIEDSMAAHLMQRDVLSRAILGTLIHYAASPPAQVLGKRPTQQRPARLRSKFTQPTRSRGRTKQKRKRQH